MNKKYITILSFISFAICFSMMLVFNLTWSNWVIHSAQSVFLSQNETYLRSLLATVKNDLLLGNIRDARAVFTQAQDQRIFSHYKILDPQSEVVDSSLDEGTDEKDF